ncbi:MAG: 4Fe-4S dicluster domain-containing protein [Candidatus Bathyarchaeota archaeon]|nr:MAG: 4Fe-4S dicluster domain-containing protein [Candidatus Bathyarchaeota archaeon]
MVATKLDPKFKDEVSKTRGGQNIKRCYQCGTCNVGCPVREIEEKYNPRKIIRMTILGMRERVLSSEFIWLCSACYTCSERCPQDVRIADVMNALKNLAVKEGHVHSSFAKRLEVIEANGRLFPVSQFDNAKRKELGLPQIPPKNEEVQELCKLVGSSKPSNVGGGG